MLFGQNVQHYTIPVQSKKVMFGDHKKQYNFQGCTPVLEVVLV